MKRTPAAIAHTKAKKLSVGYYKKKLWTLVSIYIRRRDADWSGYVACCTCGKIKHWKEGDAGHFIDGRRNSIVYDPRNIHFQCKGCNGNLRDGNISRNKADTDRAYENFMVERYGKEVVEELRAENKKTKNWSVKELKELIEIFKYKVENEILD